MKTPQHMQQHFGGWPQLICFDLDGTLIDSVPDLATAIDMCLQEQGRQAAGEERVRQWVGFGASKLVIQAMEWADINNDLYEECYRTFIMTYQKNVTEKTVLFPHVMELLKACKVNKVPLALITNKPEIFVKPILEHFNLAEYFSWILGAETLTEKKPSPLPLLHCAEAIEAKEEQCLMIGDSLTDHRAARAAGFKSALVTYGYHQGIDFQELSADLILDDLVELLL
ncbi:phosphoglycolate phosphatase [Marinomonas agarivorans]|nr:phosphoglycolate phosphatase [Marinomonas agarivorans]